MPPEIAEQRRFRRLQAGVGAAVLASAGLVGALYMQAHGSVSTAQSDLEAAQPSRRSCR